MVTSELLHNKYINKALEKFNVTIQQIRASQGTAKVGKKAKVEPYYLTYGWDNEKEYEEWKAYVKKDLLKINPNWNEKTLEEEFNLLDAIIGLNQLYLFKKAP